MHKKQSNTHYFMKIKKSLAIILGLVLALPICAQRDPFKQGKSISLFIGGQSRTETAINKEISSKFNMGLQTNFAQIKLHKGVIADMLCVRFDIGLDLNYAYYKRLQDTSNPHNDKIDWNPHQAEIGVDLGPSVYVAPFEDVRELQFMAFYHFIPSASAHIEDTNVYAAFCPMMNFGLGVNWKFIGIGYEHRWGSAKYKTYVIEDAVEGAHDTGEKTKFKTTADRFYIRFNF